MGKLALKKQKEIEGFRAEVLKYGVEEMFSSYFEGRKMQL